MHPLDTLVLLASGLAAAGIWMLRYERSQIESLYGNAVLRHLIDALCEISGEQKPTGANARPNIPTTAASEAAVGFRIPSDLSPRLKERFRGMDETIEKLQSHLEASARMTASLDHKITRPPLGLYLMTGPSGLGKRSFSQAVAEILFPGVECLIFDACVEQTPQRLVQAAREVPRRAFIVDKVQLASPPLLSLLEQISRGRTIPEEGTGARVSFASTLFFLLLHEDTPQLSAKRVAGQSGETVVVDYLAAEKGVDRNLAWMAHAIFPFHLPQTMQCAEIVVDLIRRECAAYGLTLRWVNPQIVAHETKAVVSAGNLELAPARLTRRLHPQIKESLAARRKDVEFHLTAQQTAACYEDALR